MSNVAHLLDDMARTIRVCDKTLEYIEQATADQQRRLEAAKRESNGGS